MKYNLLMKSIISAGLVSTLAACGGVDKGYDPKFGSDIPVTWDDSAPIAKTIKAGSGNVTLDLSEGSTVDGQPLDLKTNIFFRDFVFSPPEGYTLPTRKGDPAKNEKTTQNINAISVVGNHTHEMVVESDLFTPTLSSCPAGQQANPAKVKPSQVSIDFSYTIDNGYKYPLEAEIPTRDFVLTILAADAPALESFTPSVDTLSIREGKSELFTIAHAPVDACRDWSYSFTIPDVASIDPATLIVTGEKEGTTDLVMTSGSLSKTITITVTPPPGKEVSIANATVETVNDVTTKYKTVPECMNSAFYADSLVGGEKQVGDMAYSWTTGNGNVTDMKSDSIEDYSGVLRLGAPTVADETSTVTVTIDSGTVSEGENQGTDLAGLTDTVEVSVADNAMCDPFKDGATAESFVGQFEKILYWEKTDSSLPNWWGDLKFVGLPGSVLSTTDDGVTDKALTVTAPADATAETQVGAFFQGYFQDNATHKISKALVHTHRLNKTGVKFKTAVWVKLDKVYDSPLTLNHYVYPRQWNTGWASLVPSDGQPKSAYHRRENPAAATFTAKLRNTTEWQYVEFINAKELDGRATFELTQAWFDSNSNTDKVSAEPQFMIQGLDAGATIKFDEYSLMIVEYPDEATSPALFTIN